jgi:hypothetical protein
VTVSETCTSIAYAAHDVDQDATQMIIAAAVKSLGTGYSLIGEIRIHIIHAAITTNRQGQAQIWIQITGTWVYQITPHIQEQLVMLITGRPQQQAVSLLLSQPGIQGVQINVKGGGNRTLP